MQQGDDRDRVLTAPRDRLSRLSRAAWRINETAEPGDVLQELLHSARSLTDASFGLIIILDDSGQIESFVTSGHAPSEQQSLWSTDGGDELLRHLSQVSGPFRLRDPSAYMRSQGFPEPHPTTGFNSFLGTTVRHREFSMGYVYVGEKDGESEFNPEDEEILEMFAAQAALVIASTRRDREERKARADLETLINTSPVGVLVFDAATGSLQMANEEARRFGGVDRQPDTAARYLLSNMVVRRADRSEVSLSAISLATAASIKHGLQSEEMSLFLPDGRSATALVNATPIACEDGEVETVIVTLQDLAPVHELERLRADFLGMVSHELQAPLTSIKGSADTLLEEAATREEALPYEFGPPATLMPPHELLAAELAALDRHAEARTAREQQLARTPKRTQSLLGLARTAMALGDEVAAREAYAVLAEVWAGADRGVSVPAGSDRSGNFIP